MVPSILIREVAQITSEQPLKKENMTKGGKFIKMWGL